jgi:hypothetical protein
MSRSPSGPVCASPLYLLSHIMSTEMTESLESVGMIWTSYYYSIFISVASTWSIGISETLFHFLNFRESVKLLGRGISPSQGRCLHRTTQTQNKRRQTYMP